jgi:hypothetical protein
MKSLSIFFLLIVFLFSCKGVHDPKPITSVTILIDQTGDELALPSAESIKKLYDLRKRTERGGIFTLQSIGELQYAPSVTVDIEPQPMLMQNLGQRKKAINDFLAKISLSLDQVSLQPDGKSRSEIFVPVIQALNALAAQNVDERIVIILSDLAENSRFSVYNKTDLKLLLDSPDVVIKKLSRTVELGDMRNVSVEFRYTAKGYEDSQRYGLMVALYRKLIESKGGKVFISGGSLLN